MKAELLLSERQIFDDRSFAEIRIWRVPKPVAASAHNYKYALAYVVSGVCVLRYDNEAGKGDHRHVGAVETSYLFKTPQALLADFWNDIDEWRSS